MGFIHGGAIKIYEASQGERTGFKLNPLQANDRNKRACLPQKNKKSETLLTTYHDFLGRLLNNTYKAYFS